MCYRLMLVSLLVLVSLAAQRTRTTSAQGATYTDPFAYCAAFGTVDAPGPRYVGPPVPDAVVRGLHTAMQRGSEAPPDWFRVGTSWRCMEGQVYACTVGANLPCEGKANTSRTPTAEMTRYCQANPTANALPAVVTGRTTVYGWSCQNGVATPGQQHTQVDARGFLANIWYAIRPPGSSGAQTLPQTGGAGILSDRMGTLLALGAMVALLGLVLRRRAVVV